MVGSGLMANGGGCWKEGAFFCCCYFFLTQRRFPLNPPMEGGYARLALEVREEKKGSTFSVEPPG